MKPSRTLNMIMNHWTAELKNPKGYFDLPFNIEEFCIECDEAYQAIEARHKKLLEALKFIVSKENIMFAECTDAEEILLKCKQAIEADAKASGE